MPTQSLVTTLAANQYAACRAGKKAPGITPDMWRKALGDVPSCSSAKWLQMSVATKSGTGAIAGESREG